MDGSPTVGTVPLRRAFGAAHGQPSGLLKQINISRHPVRLFLRCKSRPERIKRGGVFISGLGMRGKIIIKEQKTLGVPEKFVNAFLPFQSFFMPASSVIGPAEDVAHLLQVFLSFVKQT